MLTRFALLGALLTISHGASLWAVEAGSVSESGPIDIGKLSSTESKTVRICPEKYHGGFSIECRGEDIDPNGGVSFFLNDAFIHMEGGSPPYMAASDLDSGPDGLTYIAPLQYWNVPNRRCRNTNKDCVFKLKCKHRNGMVEKTIVIEKTGCAQPAKSPPVPLSPLGRNYSCGGAPLNFTTETTAVGIDQELAHVYEYTYDPSSLTARGVLFINITENNCPPRNAGPFTSSVYGNMTIKFAPNLTMATSLEIQACNGAVASDSCIQVGA